MDENKIAVFIHIFYKDGWELIFPQLKNLEQFKLNLFVNICDDNSEKENIISKIRSSFKSAIIITTPNVGKDIGGKMVLLTLQYYSWLFVTF